MLPLYLVKRINSLEIMKLSAAIPEIIFFLLIILLQQCSSKFQFVSYMHQLLIITVSLWESILFGISQWQQTMRPHPKYFVIWAGAQHDQFILCVWSL